MPPLEAARFRCTVASFAVFFLATAEGSTWKCKAGPILSFVHCCDTSPSDPKLTGYFQTRRRGAFSERLGDEASEKRLRTDVGVFREHLRNSVIVSNGKIT